MSSYLLLDAVSNLLRKTLWEVFKDDPVTATIISSESAIVFSNPAETAHDASNRLSLWLYQITEDGVERNQPLPANPRLGKSAPLLSLHYLLTPFGPNAESDLLLTGRTMQTFFDHPVLQVEQVVDGIPVSKELRILSAGLSMQESIRIWEGLREPYRLSVAYDVHIAP